MVTSAITNGLATTNYVNSITNGLATTNYVNSITNGLATTNYVLTQITSNGIFGGVGHTNGVVYGNGASITNITLNNITNVGTAAYSNATAFYLNSNPSNYITSSVTNGLATTDYVNAATNGLATTNYVNAATIANSQLPATLTNNITGNASGATNDAAGNNIAATYQTAAQVAAAKVLLATNSITATNRPDGTPLNSLPTTAQPPSSTLSNLVNFVFTPLNLVGGTNLPASGVSTNGSTAGQVLTSSNGVAQWTTPSSSGGVNLTNSTNVFMGKFASIVSTSGVAIYGSSTADISVSGYSSASYGVSGNSSVTAGVYGNSTGDVGVSGYSSASYGVYGNSSANAGVAGNSSANVGVYGNSSASYGVYGYSTGGVGVYGWSTITTAGVYGTSLGGPGVAGNSYGANSYGVTGTSIGGHGVYSSGDLYAPSNSAAYVTFNSPTVSVVLGSNWTNTYGVRIQLIVDGTLNMAVAGSTVLTFTNLTTAESHIVAGTTISIAGTTYFSDNELISKGNIVKYTAANTGTATTSINKTTVKIQ